MHEDRKNGEVQGVDEAGLFTWDIECRVALPVLLYVRRIDTEKCPLGDADNARMG